MQSNIQAFNEGKNSKSTVEFRENFNTLLDKSVGDLKKFFHEKKLIHHTTTENKKSRSGYIEISKIFKNYGFVTQDFIETYSSGEESDIEDDKIHEPSVREVNEKILDFRTIINVKKISSFPKNVRPGIVFINLEEWVTLPILKRYIEEIPIFSDENLPPKISDIRIFNYKNIIFGLILFFDHEITRKVYSFFNHPQKVSNNPSKNSKGDTIDIKYVFDLLDMENSEWYGVILRNIPEKCSHENLKNFLKNYSKQINYLLPATKIKNSYCSIVVLDSLEEAEKICKCINKREMGKNRFIKAHLHPRSSHMRRNPENSIFNNYYRLDNGNYYRKYIPNNLGNILNANETNQTSFSKYTPINRILINIIDSKLNNSQSNNNQPSSGNNNNNFDLKNKENEGNQKLQDKDNLLNKKRQSNNSTNKDASLPSSNSQIFKKSTDFLNLYFDEEEKNKKKQTMDINTSYLTKLIMKPTGSNTSNFEETKVNREVNNISTSSVNLFIANMEEDKNIRETKENKNDNVKKENYIKNKAKNGNIEKFKIGVVKNDSWQELNLVTKEVSQIVAEKEDENIQPIPKRTLELFSEDYKNEIKMKRISTGEKVQEENSNILLSNEEKLSKAKDNKKDFKQSGKRLEIGLIGSSYISEITLNQPNNQPDLIKITNSYTTTNINNTPVNTNLNRKESIISNLSGILKEMVKSDKEKTLKNQTCEPDNNINPNSNKNNQDKSLNDKVLSKAEIIIPDNSKEKMDASEEEMIYLKVPSYDYEFFKYDFQEKSYYDKPKNYRTHYKSNRDERSFHSYSKSIYDRSRDRDRDKDRDKDRSYPYSKLNDKFSKKSGYVSEENLSQKNSYIDNHLISYQQNLRITNVNNSNQIPKIITNSSSTTNFQNNSFINNQIKDMNPNLEHNSNVGTSSKTRFSNISSLINNNAIDNCSYKDPKISNSRHNQMSASLINNNNSNEVSNINSNTNNFNGNFIQINNQVNNNYSNNPNNINYIPNNQQNQVPNKNNSQAQFQSQHPNSSVFTNKQNISAQQSNNTFMSNKISTAQQMPFNPIIQNNSTIINNYINIIPPMTTDLGKDMHVTHNITNNLNNAQFQTTHSGSSFNNVSFPSGAVNPVNISNMNLIYQKKANPIINKVSMNPDISNNKKNYSSVPNLAHNILIQNGKINERNDNIQYFKQDETENNYNEKRTINPKSNLNISTIQYSELEKSNENKKEIILPPSDDFIPPLPPENPPEPDITKFDDFEQFTALKEDYFSYKKDINEDRQGGRKKYENRMNKSDDQMMPLHQLEKTEPGQILNYDSEDGSITNMNNFKLDKISKKIDVKNAPINFKKYNFSRSSSSSLRSFRKKDYLNRKRDREKTRKYSREREREKEKKRKKYRSRSRERNTNNISNATNYEKTSNGISIKRENRDIKDYIPRHGSSKKYNDGNKKFYKHDNRSSSSSSSFQSGEEGRYYKRFMERRTNIKKEKK